MTAKDLENRLEQLPMTSGLQALLAVHATQGGDLRDSALEYLLSGGTGQSYRQHEDRLTELEDQVTELEDIIDQARGMASDLERHLSPY